MYCGDADAVWVSSNKYGCLAGALLNGAFALAGEDAAAAVGLIVDEQGVWGVDLSVLGFVLQRVSFTSLRVRVRLAPAASRAAMNSSHRRAVLRWIVNSNEGVLLVHFRAPRV
eukprot:IDg21033t1